MVIAENAAVKVPDRDMGISRRGKCIPHPRFPSSLLLLPLPLPIFFFISCSFFPYPYP
jgi:hypothetical protein